MAGLIGKLYGQIDARKIKLQHTTLNDFPISGNQNVGGLIGEAFLQAASSFKDITTPLDLRPICRIGQLEVLDGDEDIGRGFRPDLTDQSADIGATFDREIIWSNRCQKN